jgi:nitroreductase
MNRAAPTDHPVHELIAHRWSPCGFSNRVVSREELLCLLEAARWAPSSYNEQPWRFIVAVREDADQFERVLSCMVEANQTWAKTAAVLMLTVAGEVFAKNAKPNRHAFHDVGQAAANMAIEAASRGMQLHQMAGILPDKAREVFDIPPHWDAVTGIAIGYPVDDPATLPQDLRDRDTAPRSRKPLEELVFGAKFGRSAIT